MKKLLLNISSDIKQRKNIELYLVLTAVVIIFAADILGVNSDTILSEIILAALAALLFGILENRHDSDEIKQQLSVISREAVEISKDMLYWENVNENFSTETLDFANLIKVDELFIVAPYLPSAIIFNSKSFFRELSKGKRVRIILPSASILKRDYDTDGIHEGKEYIRKLRNLISGLELIENWLKSENKLEIRTITANPVNSIIISNPNGDDGQILYIPFLYGDFGYSEFTETDRPSAIISKKKHPHWYRNFYQRYYVDMWNAASGTNETLSGIIAELKEAITEVDQ